MSAWQALGAGGRAIIVVLGAAGMAAVGYVAWQMGQRASSPPPVVEAIAETAVETDADAGAPEPPTATAAPDATVTPPVEPQPPTFDNWRVATDGEAVVSGRGAPGAIVAIMVDGTTMADTAITAAGEFAALFSLPPNDKPSLMSLMMILPDGVKIPSDQTVALGPIAGLPAVEAATEDVAAVDAPAPAAILLTDEGAVVLQDDQSDVAVVQANVTIDTISYTPTGDVQLGGRAAADAFVRIYLDNVPVQTVLVPQSGLWLSTLNDTAPGIYTLRADQIDDAGNVTSRFETPFKRETLEALATVTAEADPGQAAAEAPVPQPEVVASADAPGPLVDPVPDQSAVATTVVEAPEALTNEAAVLAPPAPQDSVAIATASPPPKDPPVAAEPMPVKSAPVTITVQPGFTLWGIAQENFGDGVMYVQVFDANKEKIKDPNLIYPGQVFSIPAMDGG